MVPIKIKFRSAIDRWYYLLAIVLPLVLIFLMVSSIESAPLEILIVLGISVLIALLLPILLFTTYYIIDSGKLKIRSGPFFRIIRLCDIKAVRPSHSTLASPALSFNRLEIHYGKNKSVLVSPKDIEGFRNAISKA